MKKTYKQPIIKVHKLSPRTAMLTFTSLGEGLEGTGIDDEPGDEDDFA